MRGKTVSKFTCSDHPLEIEIGRHKGTPRHERPRSLCQNGQMEDDEHLLFSCNLYNSIRTRYNFEHFTTPQDLFTGNGCDLLGKLLAEVFKTRQDMNKVRVIS